MGLWKGMLVLAVFALIPAAWVTAQETGETPAADGSHAEGNYEHGEEAAGTQEAAGEYEEAGEEHEEDEEYEEHGANWIDGVHIAGIIGGGVAFLALCGGLYIVLIARRGPIRRRLKLRWVHMAAGTIAVALAVGHAIGRGIQEGEFELGFAPPRLSGAFFVLILLTGASRQWTPGFLKGAPALLAWLHRIAVVAALYYMLRHTIYQYISFVGA
ncbi:MAG: hypothetical protein QM473_10370 [Acidobacteriota bacterium]|nr:hypothetical protein [Acidobacteriota bacterium]